MKEKSLESVAQVCMQARTTLSLPNSRVKFTHTHTQACYTYNDWGQVIVQLWNLHVAAEPGYAASEPEEGADDLQ